MGAHSVSIRTRWAAIGAAVAVTVGAVGVGGYNLVSADVSSGDRPVFIPINPCRLTDTRTTPNTVGPRSTPIGVDETIAITAHGSNGECTEASAIPADAVALAMNVTALNATEQTFLTFWGDGDNPGTANLNPAPDQPPTPNAVNTPLSSVGTFNLYNERGTVDVVIDVNGYYADHNHDDRYVAIDDAFTKDEADTLYPNDDDVYTKDEADTMFLTDPDKVVLSGFDFQSDDPAGDAWVVDEGFGHEPTGPNECVYTSVELPVGRSIAGASITYSAATPGEATLSLYGVVNAGGDYTSSDEISEVVIDDTQPLVPSPGELTIPEQEFSAAPGSVVSDSFSYVVEVCTNMSMGLFAVSIDTPEV